MIWYIDTENGNNSNNGHTKAAPLKDLSKFYYQGVSTPVLKHGDIVLIKRNSVFNEDDTHRIYTNNYSQQRHEKVLISTYGEGDNPVFTAHKILDKVNLEEHTTNIYKVDLSTPLITEGIDTTDNNIAFIYDKINDKIYSDRKFNLQDLQENMQFFIDEDILYIYIEDIDNIPNKLYLPVNKTPLVTDANLIIENMTFTLTGKHGIQTSSDSGNYNIVVRNCKFEKIGGSLYTGTTRYGNGFECYGQGTDITVENCIFTDIYDTGVTIQGQGASFRNITFKHNIFKRCTQPCEQWADNSTYGGAGYVNCMFSDNLCLLSGYGFGNIGRQNGYAFILNNLTNLSNTEYTIKNNIFYKSKDGIYNLTSLEGTSVKFLDNKIYGYSNQVINNQYEDLTMQNAEEYKNTVKQDITSDFIVLEEDLENGVLENILLSSNLFMNNIDYNYNSSNADIDNYITNLPVSSGNLNLTVAKAVVINNMLLISVVGTATQDIAQFQTIATISTPNLTLVQQSMANPNNAGTQRLYLTAYSDQCFVQPYYAISTGTKVEFHDVIALKEID